MGKFFDFFKDKLNLEQDNSNQNSEHKSNTENNNLENVVVSFAPGFKDYLKVYKVYENLKKSLEKYEKLLEIREKEDSYAFSKSPYSFNDVRDLKAEISMTMLAAIHDGYIDAFKFQDKNNNNETLGIKLVKLGLKEVAMKVVEDKECAMIKDDFGFSMPFYAIVNDLEPVVTYALQHEEVATQTFGDEEENLGMIAAHCKMENAVIQALVHHDACLQQSKEKNDYGKNIGMFAACNRLDNATLIALNNEQACAQTDKDGNNIPLYACKYNLSDSIVKCLKHPTYPLHQNKEGMNMGMVLAYNESFLTLTALENKEASLQQNNKGQNIGMICAEKYFEDGVMESLENIEASCQQDLNGNTIGIISARQNLIGCAVKASLIKESREIKDNDGYSVLSILEDRNIPIPDSNILNDARFLVRDLQKNYSFDLNSDELIDDVKMSLFNFEKGLSLAYNGLKPDYDITDNYYDQFEDDSDESELS